MDLLEFIQSSLLAGAATTLATQILKSPAIPIPAQHHPKLTAVIVSMVAAGMVVYQGVHNSYATFDVLEWATVSIATLLIAVVTYNNIVKPKA